MIYKNEADFLYGTKWQNTVPWVTPVCHFDFTPKLFSVYPLKMKHFCRFLCISFFWTLQIPFVVHKTTHVSYITVTKFICGWCQAICSKLRCQMLEFPLCLPKIPNFCPVVYMETVFNVTSNLNWLAIWSGHVDLVVTKRIHPDSKVHRANMGPTWVLSAPDGPHVGPMNLAIRANITSLRTSRRIAYYCLPVIRREWYKE